MAVFVPRSHLEQYAWLCTQPHTYYVCDMAGRLLFGTCIFVTWIIGWWRVGAPWGWMVPPAIYSTFIFVEFGFAAYYGPVVWADSRVGALLCPYAVSTAMQCLSLQSWQDNRCILPL